MAFQGFSSRANRNRWKRKSRRPEPATRPFPLVAASHRGRLTARPKKMRNPRRSARGFLFLARERFSRKRRNKAVARAAAESHGRRKYCFPGKRKQAAWPRSEARGDQGGSTTAPWWTESQKAGSSPQ
jgi:hypothetical protein